MSINFMIKLQVLSLTSYQLFLSITMKLMNRMTIHEIEYFQTMLPIWLLKRTANEASWRKVAQHEVTIHTPGMEKH